MFLQDIRYAVRILLKSPGFLVVAVLSLAIGIGANSAMFSLADALLLRPLPVRHPGQVVAVEGKAGQDSTSSNLSYRDYVDIRDHNKAFESLVAYTLVPFGFSPNAQTLPLVKYGYLISGNLFTGMGVQPQIGRTFRPDEDQVPGRDAVAILGHDFWQQQYAGDPSVIGKSMRLNGIEFSIIGVLPESFPGMENYIHAAVFVPVAMSPRLASEPKNNLLEARDKRALSVKGRLKPGVTVAQANAEVAAIGKGLQQSYPKTNHDFELQARTEFQYRTEQDPYDAMLLAMLMGLSGLVLLVACANVANLLLSRSRARAREMAVRIAIGAGRGRLIRQLLTESLLIAATGAALGIAIAYAGVLFLRQIPVPTDIPLVFTVDVDQRVLLFSLGAMILSVLLFGLAPALATTRTDLVPALKSADADLAGKRRLWGRNLLVVGQVASSVVLLVVAAMMYGGFRAQLTGGLGFRTSHLVMMSFDPTVVRSTETQAQQFFKQVVDGAATVPGVKSAALTEVLPMAPTQHTVDVIPEGYVFPKGKESDDLLSSTVDPHYFETMDVKIVRGRGFLETDSEHAPKVAVINEAFARKFWPGQDAIGKRLRVGDSKAPWLQIVGIAKTGKYVWIAEPPLEFVYLPLAQHPQPRITLLAETIGDSAGVIAPLREMVRRIDPNQPIFGVRTMEDLYQMRAVSTPNIILDVVASLGFAGLVLAMVGLYGLVAYSVSRRTREFGIRIAIGAQRGNVLGIVMKQGIVLALTGIVVGIVLSIPAKQVLQASFITGSPDPLAFALVPPMLFLITLLAAYAPAFRASQIDPIRALRDE